MKMNKNLTRILVLCFCVLCLALTATAQKKRTTRRTTTPRPPAATTTPVVTSPLEVKTGAEKVSTQIMNVTKFIYTLGGVSRGIEDADKDARTGKLSKAVVDKNTQFKQQVIQSMRNLQAGLAALEVEFRTKPSLRPYLLQIQGITDLAGAAEGQASAGQLTQSGKTLLLVVEKLSTTLVAMP
jgi:hypothetical protein